jgi:hypothetical protein
VRFPADKEQAMAPDTDLTQASEGELDALIAGLDAEQDALEPTGQTQDEWDRLQARAAEAREVKRQRAAKKDAEVAARQASTRDDLKAMAAEAAKLTTALAAPDLAPEAQVEMRERLAFLQVRSADLSAGIEWAGVQTPTLEAELEQVEIDREEALLRLTALERERGPDSPKVRQLRREVETMFERQVGLRTELGARQVREANEVLLRQRAEVHARRELEAEDREELAGVSDWRLGQRAEQLATSLPKRLAERTAQVQRRMLAEAEAEIGSRLLGTGAAHGGLAEADRQRAAERVLAEARKKYGTTT